MGAGKATYTTLKVFAVLLSLTATVSGALIVLDVSKVNPPKITTTDFHYVSGPPAWLNVSFSVTIEYGGSVFSISNVNLTFGIYPNADGLGTPLFANTTILTLSPHSSTTLHYDISLMNPPSFTHLSAKAAANGFISAAGISFIGFGLDVLVAFFP